MPFQLPGIWPQAADADAAARLIERFAALGAAEARAAARSDVACLLAAIGGNSPFLADLVLREAAMLRLLLRAGPAAAAARALRLLDRLPATAPRERVAAALREAKRQIALAIAIADIGGAWTLEQVTQSLSAFAERALRVAVTHLLRAAHDEGALRLPTPVDPEQGCGFTVLGMGKFGARELNYSSDIDLFLLYDPAVHSHHVSDLRRVFMRFSRDLVSLMETRDAGGYVFRTDLRLRPDPAATPPAVALPAALTYYESMGQNWERAAMIKARPVAGDLALGTQFLEAIRPFVWRRHLDFAAIADIHAMKRRIDEHRGTALTGSGDATSRVAGHNVKLGEGGIREIEFLVQTLQLVWGGRDPSLRDPTTLGALRLLARSGHLPRSAATELAAAYRFLRGVEHRLQMVADRQTHSLPTSAEELTRFAIFLGYGTADEFARTLLAHLGRVRDRYAHLFQEVPKMPADVPRLDFSGPAEAPAATTAALRTLGFKDVTRVVDSVRSWQAGRPRALRSERARQLLGEVLPTLLTALAKQKEPDVAFARFDEFVSRLPAGVQLLSLFQRNPALLARIAAVLGAAPSLSDHLARVPSALEGLLAAESAADPDPLLSLRKQLRDARLLEDAIEIARRFVRGEEFRIALAGMEGRIDVDAAGEARTALADATIACLLPRVMAEFADRNGRVRGGGMVVVAMGKAGGREMLAGSDLDLMLIYDHPADVGESSGVRHLPVSQYYIRAAHAFVAALTAPGLEGPLYAVDMRLRPSGNKGPVAVSLDGFRRYHAADAWTWERMALTRARVVAGPVALRGRVETAIADALGHVGPPDKVRRDAVAMRARLARDLPASGPWDVKHRVGGLMEVEFVAQALQLVHAPARPDICSPTTRIALARLRDAALLDAADAKTLIHADRVWRGLQGMLRITLGRNLGEALPEAVVQPVLRAVGEGVDLVTLPATLDELARAVRAAFIRQLGDPETAT